WSAPAFLCVLRSRLLCGLLYGPQLRRLCLVLRVHIAKMNRRLLATGTLSLSKSFHRPHGFDAALWRHHLRNRTLPLRANLVAIIPAAINPTKDTLFRRHRRILRGLALLLQEAR